MGRYEIISDAKRFECSGNAAYGMVRVRDTEDPAHSELDVRVDTKQSRIILPDGTEAPLNLDSYKKLKQEKGKGTEAQQNACEEMEASAKPAALAPRTADAGSVAIRPTLRLWGVWSGVYTAYKGFANYEERSAEVFGPAISVGISTPSRSSFFVETGIEFFYGGGPFTERIELASDSSFYPDRTMTPRDDHFTGSLWSFSSRNCLGYDFSSFGLYVMPPLIGGITISESPSGTFGGWGFSLIGAGVFIGDRLVFIEGSLVSFAESQRGSGPNDISPRIFGARVGIDLISLFGSGSQSGPLYSRNENTPLPRPPSLPPTVETPVAPVLPTPPVVPPAEIRGQQIVINQRIHFDFDRFEIKPESYPILDAVAELLKQHPEVRRVQIQGHTDDVGTDDHNLHLSQQRADAVREYLVARGIDSSRLVAVGLGRTRPLVSGTTEEARAQNRRTEFVILERQDP